MTYQHPLAYLLAVEGAALMRAAAGFPNVWHLRTFCPAATNAAYADTPAAIIWHFQLDDVAAR